MKPIRQGILQRPKKHTGNKVNIESQDVNLHSEVSKVQQKKDRLEQIDHHRAKVYIGNREDKQEIVQQIQNDIKQQAEIKTMFRQQAKAQELAKDREMIAHAKHLETIERNKIMQKRMWAAETLQDNKFFESRHQLDKQSQKLSGVLEDQRNERYNTTHYRRTFL